VKSATGTITFRELIPHFIWPRTDISYKMTAFLHTVFLTCIYTIFLTVVCVYINGLFFAEAS